MGHQPGLTTLLANTPGLFSAGALINTPSDLERRVRGRQARRRGGKAVNDTGRRVG